MRREGRRCQRKRGSRGGGRGGYGLLSRIGGTMGEEEKEKQEEVSFVGKETPM
jgi:hypothetical protein